MAPELLSTGRQRREPEARKPRSPEAPKPRSRCRPGGRAAESPRSTMPPGPLSTGRPRRPARGRRPTVVPRSQREGTPNCGRWQRFVGHPPQLPFPSHPVGSSKARPKIPGPTSTNRRQSFRSALWAEAVTRGAATGAGRGRAWPVALVQSSRLGASVPHVERTQLHQSAAAGGGRGGGTEA